MKKDDDLTHLKELLEIVAHKVDRMEPSRTFQSATLHLMKDQQSVMNEKLDGLVERLDDPDSGLESINSKLIALSGDVERLQDKVKGIKDEIGL